jgi:hypothetical protein
MIALRRMVAVVGNNLTFRGQPLPWEEEEESIVQRP